MKEVVMLYILKDLLFWYVVQGLFALFWAHFLDGGISGDKWWHTPANVMICVLGWPVLMIGLVVKSFRK